MDTDNKEFTLAPEDPCPCGSGKKFGECCAKALKDGCWPETAEALMRARYTAYALHDYQYLVDTTLPSERDKDFSAEKLEEQSRDVNWVRLSVVKTGDTTREDSVDYDLVDFYAYYTMHGATMQLGEHAYFTKGEDGRIYYAHGYKLRPEPFRRSQPKVAAMIPAPAEAAKNTKIAAAAIRRKLWEKSVSRLTPFFPSYSAPWNESGNSVSIVRAVRKVLSPAVRIAAAPFSPSVSACGKTPLPTWPQGTSRDSVSGLSAASACAARGEGEKSAPVAASPAAFCGSTASASCRRHTNALAEGCTFPIQWPEEGSEPDKAFPGPGFPHSFCLPRK